jgi:Cytochrome c554 and c-prime
MPQEIWKAAPVGLGLLAIALIASCPSGCSDSSSPPTVDRSAASPSKKETSASQLAGQQTVAELPTAKPAAATELPLTKAPVTTAPVTKVPMTQPTVAKTPAQQSPAKESPVQVAQKESVKKAPAKRIPEGPKPILDGWSKPAFAIVLSGEQHGYMEPCGCSLTQSGGLSRRADGFRQISKEKGWALTALDLGGLVRKDNEQNKLKFQVMLSALNELGYKAMALGTEELQLERLTPGFLLSQAAPLNDGKSLSLVNANVEFALFKEAGATPAVPTRIVTIDGHKFGVTAIFGDSLKRVLFGNAPDPQITVKDPAEVLPAAIATLKKAQPEFLVLLAHAERDEAIALAKKFPEFQLVVTSGPEDGNDTPRQIGKTLLVEVGQKGKHIAVVGYYPDNKTNPFRFELIDLDKERFKDTPAMLDHMREYQHMLESNYDTVLQDLPKSPAPGGDHYAGVENCKGCHTKAYAVWKDSKHAHAFESLITGRAGTKNPISRIHDPECIACHTTGWDPQQMIRYDSGFYSAEKTPQLKEQQCENCHGPAAHHTELEARWKKDQASVKKDDLDAARHRLHLTVAEAKKSLCYRCHDLDNDPNFNSNTFSDYWEQIVHPGKD